MPALVVASAGAPASSITRALTASQAFTRTSGAPPRCSRWKVSARSCAHGGRHRARNSSDAATADLAILAAAGRGYPAGVNCFTTSYIPGSNRARVSASPAVGRSAGPARMACVIPHAPPLARPSSPSVPSRLRWSVEPRNPGTWMTNPSVARTSSSTSSRCFAALDGEDVDHRDRTAGAVRTTHGARRLRLRRSSRPAPDRLAQRPHARARTSRMGEHAGPGHQDVRARRRPPAAR